MNPSIRNLTVDQRLRIVEDLWDSIAEDQQALSLSEKQKIELDRRLEAFALDGNQGRLAEDALAKIRKRL
ncbi:MAG: addiction module protein [Candidatus Omnitrophota bacterium]